MTLIEGDGIGPEISKSVKDIFAAANVKEEPGNLESFDGQVLNLVGYRPLSSGNLSMSLLS